ncbi:glycosyltransferase family 4 protein [Mariniluteicoccus endophyticus]
MKIAVLGHLHYPIRTPYSGGLETHTAQTCAALAARGHDVTLFAKEGSEVPGVRVVPVLPAHFSWDTGSARSREEQLDRATSLACAAALSHDVVLNNSLSPVPYTVLPDMPMLTVLHTPATLERVTPVVTASTWRPGARHAWVSVSEANATGWRALLRGVRVGVVHNGIDISGWSADVTPEPGLAVWSARITPEKGLHVAIDAAREAGFALDIAGPISDAAYFVAEIAPRLGGRVRHVGHLDHGALARLLGRAGVFCASPLWDEPFGLAPLEAMACGTPVAALDRGAMRELLGTDGGVVARTPADLPRALRAAATLDRAGVRGRADRFSLQAMVDAYERRLVSLQQRPVKVLVRRADVAPLRQPLGGLEAGM